MSIRQRVFRLGLRRSAAVGAALVSCVLTIGCEGDLPFPPTECDDYCRATLRADCSEDFPDDCVGGCEQFAPGRQFPQCEAEWLRVSECYSQTDGSDFECVFDHSRPGAFCQAERLELGSCVSQSVRVCVEYCFHQADECQGNAADCEQNCFNRAEVCPAESQRVHECALAGPVVCGPGPVPVPTEQLRCTEELDAFLACADG